MTVNYANVLTKPPTTVTLASELGALTDSEMRVIVAVVNWMRTCRATKRLSFLTLQDLGNAWGVHEAKPRERIGPE